MKAERGSSRETM